MLKIAFSTLGCPAYTLDQTIRIARLNRYDGIELRALRGTTDLFSSPELSSPQSISESSKKLSDAGIAVPCVDTSIVVSGTGAEEMPQQLEMAKAHAELAAGLNAAYLRIFAGPDPDHPNPRSTYGPIADGIDAVADTAAAAGVEVLVETHGTLSGSRALLDVLTASGRNRAGVVWDVVHTHRGAGEAVEESLQRLRQLVRHVHVRDCASNHADRHDYVAAGTGVIPLDRVMRLLIADGFDGYVSFEWEKLWVPELAEPEIVIPQFAQFMAPYRR